LQYPGAVDESAIAPTCDTPVPGEPDNAEEPQTAVRTRRVGGALTKSTARDL